MAARFLRNRGVNRRIEQVIRLACPQRSAKIGGIFLPETHIERAGTGHPHAVAGFAEIVGEGRDESQSAASFSNSGISRRAAGAIGDFFKRKMFAESRPHQKER